MKEGYKQTEIGIIPEDWSVVTLIEIGQSLIGLTYKPENICDYGTLVLRSSNIQNDCLTYEDNVYVSSTLPLPSRVIVEKGDILICVRNGSRQLIGKCALIDSLAEGSAFGAFMSVFRTKFSNFVFYQFQSDVIKTQVKEIMGATINQITNKDMASFRIPLPSSEIEQRSLAQALSDIDALIAALDKLIAKQRDLKTATMQQLLTGKKRLPGFGEGQGYKESAIGLIPEDWNVKLLGELIEKLEAGVSVNSVDENNNEYGHDQSVLKTSSVYRGVFFSNECKKILPKDIHRAKLNPQKNTIIISRMNTPALVGECGYVNEDYNNLFLPDRLWITRFKKDSSINARWLAYVLSYSTFNKAIKDTATGTSGSMKNIVKDKFLQINIFFHSLKEQRAIATVLSDMDKAITVLESRLAKTQAIKRGMMQELLTGRTRLV